MLIAFFKISRCRLRYSTSLCNCRIVCAICSGLCCCPSICTGCCRFKYAFFHPCRLASLHPSSRAICTTLLPLWITISTAWLLYCSVYTGCSLFFFHRVLFLSLSSRVRQIGGGSEFEGSEAMRAEEIRNSNPIGS